MAEQLKDNKYVNTPKNFLKTKLSDAELEAAVDDYEKWMNKQAEFVSKKWDKEAGEFFLDNFDLVEFKLLASCGGSINRKGIEEALQKAPARRDVKFHQQNIFKKELGPFRQYVTVLTFGYRYSLTA